jgi:hypothetical protein
LSLVFFTDRDLGKQFPGILRSAGLAVERHLDHFAHDAVDEVWLRAIGERGWIALTHDSRIRYKPNQLAAVMQYDVALLVIIGKAPYPELARAFVSTFPRVEHFVAGHTPPYIAKVYRPSPAETARGEAAGRIELWHPR